MELIGGGALILKSPCCAEIRCLLLVSSVSKEVKEAQVQLGKALAKQKAEEAGKNSYRGVSCLSPLLAIALHLGSGYSPALVGGSSGGQVGAARIGVKEGL